MTFRLGIAGAGFLTRHSLLRAAAATEGLTVTAVLDPRPEALAAVTERFPEARCHRDPRTFLAEDLDGVHVATPNHSHAELACASLAGGLPTIVDKPLADTVGAGRQILRAAESSGTPAMVGYMSRFNACNQAVAEIIHSGGIGQPVSMTATHLGGRDGDWRNRRTDSGLGSLGDLAIYPLLTAGDLFRAQPVACRATGWPAGDPAFTDLYTEATLEYPGGERLRLESSFTEEPNVGVSRYTVVGTEGLLVVRDSWAMDGGGSAVLCDAKGRHPLRPEPVDPYVAQYRLLMDCATGRPVPAGCGIARALADLTVLTELDRSAADGGTRRTLDPTTTGPGTA